MNREDALAIINTFPQKKQSQESLVEQIDELMLTTAGTGLVLSQIDPALLSVVANRLGLYDAADHLKRVHGFAAR